MIIDFHTHVLDYGFWPDAWYDWVALRWAMSGPGRDPSTIRPKIEPGLVDPTGDRMIAAMDAAGVDMAVVLPMDWGPHFADRVPIESVNLHAIALAARYPGRIVPFVGIDPRRPGAAESVERLFKNGVVGGLKLYPPAGFDPLDPGARELYEVCIQESRPVLFHTGEPLPILDFRLGDPILLAGVHAAFPRLSTIIGHAGAKLWWPEALAVARAAIDASLELSVWIWDDTSSDEQDDFIRKLDVARKQVGMDRLLFGSDHVSGRRIRGDEFLITVTEWFRRLPERAGHLGIRFTQDDVDKLLGANAARLLRSNGHRATPEAPIDASSGP